MKTFLKGKTLPVATYKYEIVSSLDYNNFLFISGSTGSGKSTQIPQYINEIISLQKTKLYISQPRRIAAKEIANRVGTELNDPTKVAYIIKNKNTETTHSQIIFVTTGILLKLFTSEEFIKDLKYIIIDEAHEKTEDMSLIIPVLMVLHSQKPFLKVIFLTANITSLNRIINYKETNFPRIKHDLIEVKGVNYPIQISHSLKNCTVFNHFKDSIQDVLVKVTNDERTKNILIFLPDKESIKHNFVWLTKFSFGYKIFQLYSTISIEVCIQINKAYESDEKFIILSTNVAETSLTIPGINTVIDTCYKKTRVYNEVSGIHKMQLKLITQEEILQRTGRCGREGKGYCYRLITTDLANTLKIEESFDEYINSRVLLKLSSLGVQNFLEFPFFQSIEKDKLKEKIKKLIIMNLMDKKGRITTFGNDVLSFCFNLDILTLILNLLSIKKLEMEFIILIVLSLELYKDYSYLLMKVKTHEKEFGYIQCDFAKFISLLINENKLNNEIFNSFVKENFKDKLIEKLEKYLDRELKINSFDVVSIMKSKTKNDWDMTMMGFIKTYNRNFAKKRKALENNFINLEGQNVIINTNSNLYNTLTNVVFFFDIKEGKEGKLISLLWEIDNYDLLLYTNRKEIMKVKDFKLLNNNFVYKGNFKLDTKSAEVDTNEWLVESDGFFTSNIKNSAIIAEYFCKLIILKDEKLQKELNLSWKTESVTKFKAKGLFRFLQNCKVKNLETLKSVLSKNKSRINKFGVIIN